MGPDGRFLMSLQASGESVRSAIDELFPRHIGMIQDRAGTLEGQVLWIHDFARRTMSRLQTQRWSPDHIWSNDGQRITHNLIAEEETSIWERRADGSGEPEKIYAVPAGIWLIPTAWSPDGKTLAVYQRDLSKTNGDMLMLEKDAASGKWTATPYLDSPANEGALLFSPDGKWVQFISDKAGRRELYVQRFTGAGAGDQDARSGLRQISTATGVGDRAWWSPDGKEIRFMDSDDQVFSVQVQTEPTFSASLPKPIYSLKAHGASLIAYRNHGPGRRPA